MMTTWQPDVLIISDDDDIRQVLAALSEDFGCNVTSGSSALEASPWCLLAHEPRFDAALLWVGRARPDDVEPFIPLLSSPALQGATVSLVSTKSTCNLPPAPVGARWLSVPCDLDIVESMLCSVKAPSGSLIDASGHAVTGMVAA